MHAEVVSIDVSSNWKSFEAVDEEFVDRFIELLKHFSSESEVLRHGAAFVVTSEHDYTLWVVQLQKTWLGLDSLTLSE